MKNAITCILVVAALEASAYRIENGRLAFELETLDGVPSWRASYGGEEVVDVSLAGSKDDFVVQDIPVPARLVKGKDSVTVRFQAEPRNTAGGVFGLSLLKK